jgi:chromosome segregation ATPase
MAFRDRIQRWLEVPTDSADRTELQSLRAELTRMVDAAAAAQAQTAAEIAAFRERLGELNEGLGAHAARIDHLADEIVAITQRTDDATGEARGMADAAAQEREALRLKIVGVAEQLRWEGEDLRKGLAAVAERIEVARRTAP